MKKFITKQPTRPRLSVFRSNRFIYAQIIDDIKQVTLAAAHDMKAKGNEKMKRAEEVGVELAKKANKAGVTAVWFDRGGYKYHGRVKALAEGARKGGLTF